VGLERSVEIVVTTYTHWSRGHARRRPACTVLAGRSRLVRVELRDPTEAQAKGWEAIARGEHTLIHAPTGSGKTLAAFLYALDRLARDPSSARPVRIQATCASSTSPRSRP
jgi:Lhr-like helicases